MQHLMGAVFCVWCGICAKYLAFGTYPTSTVGALTRAFICTCTNDSLYSHYYLGFFFSLYIKKKKKSKW